MATKVPQTVVAGVGLQRQQQNKPYSNRIIECENMLPRRCKSKIFRDNYPSDDLKD